MKKILFFSKNNSKIKEVKKIFKRSSINFFSLVDFDLTKTPKENGSSFAENAKIKSLYGFSKTQVPCFADDSGICIEALNWKPNIKSKRFIESFKNNDDCFRYIIDRVLKTGKERANFQTAICYTIKKNHHIVFSGMVAGKISKRVRGKKNFGYDPIFIPDGFSKTFGEMNMLEKNIFSHRSIAINKLINFL